MKKTSTRIIIPVFFILTLLCVIIFVVATYRNMRQTEAQSIKVKSSLKFLVLTETLLSNLHDLESTQRGYIFSSKENFRIPWSKAVVAFASDTGRLTDMVKYIPERFKVIAELKYLIIKKIENSRQAVSLYDSAGIYPVLDMMNKGTSLKLTDSIKKRVFQIENADRNLLDQSNAYLEKSAQNTTYRFFLLAFIFFVILVLFLLIINDDLKKRNETAAQLSMQASLIDTIPDTIFTTDKNFIIKTWNKYAAEMYGFSAAEAIGKPVNSFFKVQISEDESAANLSALREKGSYKNEYPVIKKNNEAVFVLASINTIVNKEGEITGYIAVQRDITQRKQLEKELKIFNTELEQQVKIKTAETINILERITDGFLALNSNLTFTFVNKKAGEILGYDPGKMMGKNIFTDFPDTSSEDFNNACLQSFKIQQYCLLENYYEPLSLWLENDIYPSPDGLSIFFKDVTFKKKAELALKESEEQYKHLIENLHAAVVVHRPDTSILLSNHEASRLLGYSSEQMLEKKAAALQWNFVSADGKKLPLNEYPVIQVLTTGKPLNNIIVGISNQQKTENTWVLVNAFPEYDTSGKLKQIVVIFLDISDQKKTEEEIRRSEEMLNMAQAIAKLGSWEFNLKTYELKWSKELYRIFEAEHVKDEDLYEYFRNKFHPDDLEKLDNAMKYAIENSRGYQYQHRIIANDGTVKYILGIGELVKDNKGDLVGLKGSGQDITEIIKAEEKLQQSYQQIKQLVTHLQDIREQERTNMAREIHDELGQQLTGLKMYISWLNKKCIPQETEIKEKFAATMLLIEDTIISVRKISMDLRPSILDDLGLLAAMEWQSTEFEKRSGISTEFINLTNNKEVPPRVKTGLFRIFQESLTNIARHADAKKIVSSLEFDNNKLTLTITDDGKGFIYKNIDSKKTLGLLGMEERTKEMGGRYEIKSYPGMGTTVSVTVPV
jgi:PAS domain S-box-containing protein